MKKYQIPKFNEIKMKKKKNITINQCIDKNKWIAVLNKKKQKNDIHSCITWNDSTYCLDLATIILITLSLKYSVGFLAAQWPDFLERKSESGFSMRSNVCETMNTGGKGKIKKKKIKNKQSNIDKMKEKKWEGQWLRWRRAGGREEGDGGEERH